MAALALVLPVPVYLRSGREVALAGWVSPPGLAGKEVSSNGGSSSNYFKFLSISAVSFPLASSQIAAMFISSRVMF